jgi:hypothetical protein
LIWFRDVGAKAKEIIWQKEGTETVRIPWDSGYSKFGDPYFVHFNMDVTEVTVGQLKKFNTVTNCIIFV